MPEPSRRVFPTCPLCEAMCGLDVTVEGARVTSIRGDAADPLSRGHVCPKAVALQDLHTDPDRLRGPIRRTDSGWEPLGWTEAFDLVAERLRAVQQAHGRDAVAVYQGNPTIHNLGAMLFAPDFVRSLRTRNRFSATSADQLPHQFVAWLLYGHQLAMPIPDLDHTDLLLLLGSNPLASNGSIMTVPDVRNRLKALQARGGRFVVVDPRRTETAELADTHLFVRPGSDAALLAGMVHTLFEEDLVSLGRLEAFVDGVDRVRDAVADLAPEAVAGFVGLDADHIRSLARELAGAPRAAVHGRLGVCTQAFGGLAQWLVHVLNILTGNLDRVGGVLWTSPAVDLLARSGAGSFDRWRSRVRGLPEFGGELPVSALAEDILTPGEGRIRALVTSAGNPVLSTPNGTRLEQALPDLDFMVSIDPFLNETTCHADVILPPVSPLERDHYDLVFHALAVRNTARFSPAVFERAESHRHDWEIFAELTRRMQHGSLRDRLTRRALRTLGPRRQLDYALRTGPYGTLSPLGDGLSLRKLEESPHGIDLGPLRPQLPDRLWKRDRIPLAPDLVLADLPRLRESVHGARSQGLVLIGRRHLRSNNSWMHNSERLVRGRDRCTLLVHPEDAARAGLSDGQVAHVQSAVGAVEVPVEVSDTVMPGVVSLPHGWGHGRRGTQQSVASAHPGVSVNDLTDPAAVDALTGNAVLNGVPVEISPVSPPGAGAHTSP
ncbi:MAG: molybdopterin oxidoreductase family protein [Myxococcota bacterium]